MKQLFAIASILLSSLFCFSQHYSISGKIVDAKGGAAFEQVQVRLQDTDYGTVTDANGIFWFHGLEEGNYQLEASFLGYANINREVKLFGKDEYLKLQMREAASLLDETTIEGKGSEYFGLMRLRQVEGTAIYASKKTEVIQMSQIEANLAGNVSRQIYNRIPGLNVWESDGGGLQLGIGARGLSPKRTANFNTRQNGYDIAADALGYPESYYTPPAEALERIEIVRGAASLQYGTQFGGMINFRLKQAPEDEALQVTTRQTYGSFNFYNNFSSLGGTVGKLSYYTFYQFKRSDGWRPNSGFRQHMYFGNLNYAVNERFDIGLEYTHMNYLSRQAGGLTDAQFRQDSRQSTRGRNWFAVNWNLLALTADYRFNDRHKLNLRAYGNHSDKNALGKLDKVYELDIESENRELLQDQYRNFGIELRDVFRYDFFGESATLLTGVRYFHGQTEQRQGAADNSADPNFSFLNPTSLEGSAFRFPQKNFAFFSENVFNLGERFSLTPGVRVEYIDTEAEGYYTIITEDFNGNEIARSEVPESRDRDRAFVLLGIGGSFKPNASMELYANVSQNYRSITFSDIRVTNVNFAVDPDIRDETGWNADIGIRGEVRNKLYYDASLFAMRYNDRIGHIWDQTESLAGTQMIIKKVRTNIGQARTLGLEAFAELNIWKGFVNTGSRFNWTAFGNLSLTHARYLSSIVTADGSSFEGNQVELVPPAVLRFGSSWYFDEFKFSLSYNYTASQYSDASNEIGPVPTAVIGRIPAYHVTDLSASYSWRFLRIESGVNNLFDNHYFSRRAESYPGPGIIPSDGRSFFLTLQFQLSPVPQKD